MGEFDGMICVDVPLFGCMTLLGVMVLVVKLQLTPHDPNVGRRLDANANPMADDPIDRDDDSVANDEFFTNFSTEH